MKFSSFNLIHPNYMLTAQFFNLYYYFLMSDFPVISTGISTFIISSKVGAKSAKIPPSRNSKSPVPTKI